MVVFLSWGSCIERCENLWRRGGDSNPGYPFRYATFPRWCLRPLGHLSVVVIDDLPGRSSCCWTSTREFVRQHSRICATRTGGVPRSLLDGVPELLAGAQGFEPWRRLSTSDGFQDRCIRPLCHTPVSAIFVVAGTVKVETATWSTPRLSNRWRSLRLPVASTLSSWLGR